MRSKKLLWLAPLFTMAACGRGEMNRAEYSPAASVQADSTGVAGAVTDNYAAGVPLNSPARKIKRTADFHCKVRNVFSSVTKLEQLVKATGGIVQESQIENSNTEVKTSYYKPDSLKQTHTYTTTALLTLRVPAQHLDSVINSIPELSSFIDSRTLKQNDVTYRFLTNELKNNADQSNATTAMRLAKKSKDALDVQRFDAEKTGQHIDRKIENMQIVDDVNYATLTVAFSQPEQVFMQTIVNPEYITRTPFITRCRAALAAGSEMVGAIIVGLISIWPLLLVIAAILIIYSRVRQRKQTIAVRQA